MRSRIPGRVASGNVLGLEDEVLVDLVGHGDQVVLEAQAGDELELLAPEDLARRVVRRVEEQQPGPRRHGPDELVRIERPVRRPERHDPARRVRHGGACGVGVVVRLEHDDLVAALAQREQRRGDRLGGARGDEHLAVGVVVEPVALELVPRDGRAQLRHARARGVLVVAGPDGRDRHLLDLLGTVGVGEALAEVDRPGCEGERRHLGEDRRRVALETIVQVGEAGRHGPDSTVRPLRA